MVPQLCTRANFGGAGRGLQPFFLASPRERGGVPKGRRGNPSPASRELPSAEGSQDWLLGSRGLPLVREGGKEHPRRPRGTGAGSPWSPWPPEAFLLRVNMRMVSPPEAFLLRVATTNTRAAGAGRQPCLTTTFSDPNCARNSSSTFISPLHQCSRASRSAMPSSAIFMYTGTSPGS